MGKILVLAEHDKGHVKKVTLNALAFARQLAAKSGSSIEIAVLGQQVGGVAAALQGHGAAVVHVADHADLQHALASTWGKVLADLARATGATVVVGAATTMGKDVLPRTAVRLGAGMASDVVGLTDKGYQRPMWAGNLMAEVVIDTPVQVVSVRASAFDAAEASGGQSPVQAFAAESGLASAGVRFVKFEGTQSSRPDLAEASIVVSGGRGLKPEKGGFAVLEPLADVLGAAIGASRAAVDDGYAPNDYQVGQTGKVVAPQLYVAVAISGAVQHLAGMKNSKVIVAINTREDEPIFKVADYGLVGDAFSVVPELVQKLKAMRG